MAGLRGTGRPTQADVAGGRQGAPEGHARAGGRAPVLIPPDAAEVDGGALRAALRHRAQQLGPAALKLLVGAVALRPQR